MTQGPADLAPGSLHRGRVAAFDKGSGVGEVVYGAARTLPFHCTEILDGSREIAVGTEVTFSTAPGHRGRWEARGLAPA